MSFASYDFLFSFLPVTIFLAWIALTVNASRLLIPIILLSSIAFYGYTSVPHLLLLLTLIAVTWCISQAYVRVRGSVWGNLLMTLGVLINLGSLLIWKYGTSIVEAWNMLGVLEAKDPGLIMPLGISFYSLQMIGFLLDLQRKRAHVSGPFVFAAFVLFFPQLLAGPIVSHKRMMKEFDKVREGLSMKIRIDMAALGLAWITIGLFKKAVIADSLARFTIPLIVSATVKDITALEAWQVAISSGPRIYFDFSGYCDMAVGIGLLFGIHLPANFNAPGRFATNIEGLRRWHITFHNFVRDHIYRHLKKLVGGAIAGLLVFMVSALWHGDNFSYIVWGALCWGIPIVLVAFLKLFSSKYRLIMQRCLIALTYLFMPLIFIAPDLDTAFYILSRLGSFDTLPATLSAFADQGGLYLGAGILAIIYFNSEIATQKLLSNDYEHRDRHILGFRPPIWSPNLPWAIFIGALLAVSFYFAGMSSPFIYFQF